ncbi:hypothetical protein DM02DRAFT_180227 [Periconia macrospinosa]|uniref:Putative gamma-glutamylcyclotransferase n=1 Tax=Periconia macrospinosa TaxID=97972 RepID=A0A2V1D9L4_9PLEO|nr:hypothetical protein DM02DRAFT_180227 [Periconia macrospinosa]
MDEFRMSHLREHKNIKLLYILHLADIENTLLPPIPPFTYTQHQPITHIQPPPFYTKPQSNMDLLHALEDMANASMAQAENKYQAADVDRWARLFNLTHDEAQEAIDSHFSNLSRIQITETQWCILRESGGISEHDKESYSYFLSHSQQPSKKPLQSPGQNIQAGRHTKRKTEYIFKLTAPFETAGKIQQTAQLPSPPRLLVDQDTGEECFAVVDGPTRSVLEGLVTHTTWLTFAVLKKPAEKDLSSYSIAPALGVDATLPHHRGSCHHPRQSEYPVPYFFYGTLADSEVLTRLLGLQDEPVFRRAKVRGGKLGMWGGKYRALVDGEEKDEVDGWMYVVESEEQEDYLRHYEGGNYEVVRCDIIIGDEVSRGLTFRFCGDDDAVVQ